MKPFIVARMVEYFFHLFHLKTNAMNPTFFIEWSSKMRLFTGLKQPLAVTFLKKGMTRSGIKADIWA